MMGPIWAARKKQTFSLRSHSSVWDRRDAIRLGTGQKSVISLFLEQKSEKTLKYPGRSMKSNINKTKETFPSGIGPSEAASGACPCVLVAAKLQMDLVPSDNARVDTTCQDDASALLALCCTTVSYSPSLPRVYQRAQRDIHGGQ